MPCSKYMKIIYKKNCPLGNKNNFSVIPTVSYSELSDALCNVKTRPSYQKILSVKIELCL